MSQCEHRHKSIRKRSVCFFVISLYSWCYVAIMSLCRDVHTANNDITSLLCRYVASVNYALWSQQSLNLNMTWLNPNGKLIFYIFDKKVTAQNNSKNNFPFWFNQVVFTFWDKKVHVCVYRLVILHWRNGYECHTYVYTTRAIYFLLHEQGSVDL